MLNATRMAAGSRPALRASRRSRPSPATISSGGSTAGGRPPRGSQPSPRLRAIARPGSTASSSASARPRRETCRPGSGASPSRSGRPCSPAGQAEPAAPAAPGGERPGPDGAPSRDPLHVPPGRAPAAGQRPLRRTAAAASSSGVRRKGISGGCATTSPALAERLDGLARSEPICPTGGDGHPAGAYRGGARVLGTAAPIREEWRGPAYAAPGAPLPASPQAVRITPRTAGWAGFRRPGGVSRASRPAWSSPRTPRPSPSASAPGARRAPPRREWRRGTTGAARTAGPPSPLGGAVRAEHLLPLYSTSWDNLASQGLARSLGFALYGEDLSVL